MEQREKKNTRSSGCFVASFTQMVKKGLAQFEISIILVLDDILDLQRFPIRHAPRRALLGFRTSCVRPKESFYYAFVNCAVQKRVRYLD